MEACVEEMYRSLVGQSDDKEYKVFECLEDFLAAMEQTLYDYNQTRTRLAEGWRETVASAYLRHYGRPLVIPRWYDIKQRYLKAQE